MQIHQLLASLEYGDAVANQALAIQRQLRAWGHDSDLFAPRRHPQATAPLRALDELSSSTDAVTIYHHAFWSEQIEARLRNLPGRLALVYHNVTPASYFAPYREELAASSVRARAALASLKELVDLPLTVSDYNRAELVASGFRDVELLPLPIDLDAFRNVAPDPAVLRRFSDGRKNFLFVGRLSPNKRQEDVIRIFAWYHRFVDPVSRLLLVGAAPEIDDYRKDLIDVAASLGVATHVVFAGKVSFSELAAYYRVADVFLCMSEHEGFCVPLLEAMLHDLPVVARAAGATAQTLGGAGVLLHGRNVPRGAEAVRRLLDDDALRARVLARQRQRIESFGPQTFSAALAEFVARL